MSLRVLLLACIFVLQSIPASAGTAARDGQHDFDFQFGNWNVHVQKLLHPLTGSRSWVQLNGTHNVTKLWGGRSNIGVLEIDGPSGHIEGESLRLYNRQAHQWSFTFAQSSDGTLGPPMFGEFQNGRGEFYDQETYNGRTVLVRNITSDIKEHSYRDEYAYSSDGGRTWETQLDRHLYASRLIGGVLGASIAAAPLCGFAQERDGQHDFDFNFGTWHTHVQRLQHPLTHSTAWGTYDGTVTVRKVLGGKASADETVVDGLSHIALLYIRTYNPASHQWAITGASSSDGTLGTPMHGDFTGGVGTFYSREIFENRTITDRWVFSNITATSYHFEQSFSDDGGATWEPNFVASVTRTSTGAVSEGSRSIADTSHDFDFNYGSWTTHIRALNQPPRGPATWDALTGTVTMRKIWNGRGLLEEISAGTGKAAFSGITLYLYNPQSHQWSQTYADSSDGSFNAPMIGGFHNGHGELIGPDTYGGKAVLMHDAWSNITPNAHRFEIAYSLDGGKTWQRIFVANLTRKGPGL